MKKPIGVFDSGIGGLTVVKELSRTLPYEDIIYLGDTARVPYGTKSESTVIRFSLENILFLLRQDVKIIVIACNTASSLALGVARRHFKIPIIGVISPGAKEAVYATKNRRVGIIATPATIKSRSYETEIKKLNSGIKVFSFATPLFVPLVEEGWFGEKATFDITEKYLTPLKKLNIDTLILGCTHYPLLKPVIRKVMGRNVTLIDSAQQVACEAREILNGEGMLNRKRRPQDVRHLFYVTDAPQNFVRVAKRFLPWSLRNVRKVNYYV